MAFILSNAEVTHSRHRSWRNISEGRVDSGVGRLTEGVIPVFDCRDCVRTNGVSVQIHSRLSNPKQARGDT
jgi:hypothetical protein